MDRPTAGYVSHYRRLGYQPLPSDPRPHDEGGRKKPLIRYADLWERRADSDLFAKFPSANVQVMLGTFWGLCVLDIDGPNAIRHVEAVWPTFPKTWVSYHGRGDTSRHVWFTTPVCDRPRPKRVLWQGPEKHSAVELLCDRSLIMAPPSVHPKTRGQYTFMCGRSPKAVVRPAPCPAWLWDMPPLPSNVPVGTFEPEPTFVQPRTSKTFDGVDSATVLSVLPVEQVARGWGLRFGKGRPSPEGWVSVHDFDREDRNPSAAFNVVSGRFWRPGGFGGRQTMSLFDLGVSLGHFSDWRECRQSLAEYYNVSPRMTQR